MTNIDNTQDPINTPEPQHIDNNSNNATIISGNGDPQRKDPAEDTGAKAYMQTINDQQEQINMLLERNKTLQAEIAELVNGGAQIQTDNNNKQNANNNPSLTENYVSLSDMGLMIGKKKE